MTQILELSSTSNYGFEGSNNPALTRLPALAYHRTVLISSHPLFLVGLRTELSQYADLKVVGEASSAGVALEIIASSPVGLIVIDQIKPGQAVPVITALQNRLNGRIPIVVLGSTETEAQINQLYGLGVKGFASKALDGTSLGEVLRKAVQNRRPLPGIRSLQADDQWPVRHDYSGATRVSSAKEGRPSARSILSPREIEILQVIAQGCSNKEVAQILCISNHTLKNHLNNIFKKLDVEDRTQALMLSVRNGWVTL